MRAALAEQLRAGFLLSTSYRLSFVLGLVARLWALVWVYFLARLVPSDRIASAEMAQGYLAFAALGVATEQYLHFVLSAFSEKLREDQLNGLVPALLATPAPAVVALFGPVTWGLLERALTLVLALVLVSFGFGVSFAAANWPAALLVLLLMTIAVASWGVLSACFTLVFKRGDPVLWLSDTLGFVFSGAIFPVSMLPGWMRVVSALYPHAHAVSAARGALLRGESVAELGVPLVVLGAFCLVLAPLSAGALNLAVRHVRRAGSAAFY